jgi:hypothetical protein
MYGSVTVPAGTATGCRSVMLRRDTDQPAAVPITLRARSTTSPISPTRRADCGFETAGGERGSVGPEKSSR